MDAHTFLVNRERAVDYLNSLDKVIWIFTLSKLGFSCVLFHNDNYVASINDIQVFVNDQFLNWDPENRIKVRIVSARAYHSLFMHNM